MTATASPPRSERVSVPGTNVTAEWSADETRLIVRHAGCGHRLFDLWQEEEEGRMVHIVERRCSGCRQLQQEGLDYEPGPPHVWPCEYDRAFLGYLEPSKGRIAFRCKCKAEIRVTGAAIAACFEWETREEGEDES